MSLSSDLISQFAKITNDNTETKKETMVYGTIVDYDGSKWVRLDGSDRLTPIETTTNTQDGDRVTVEIKNHTATVTGNITSPSATDKDLSDVNNQISEFEIVMAYKVTANDLEAINATIESLRAVAAKIDNADILNAEIHNLQAKYAELDKITAKEVEILNAEIERLEATFGDFTNISVEDLEAIDANIENLKSYNANFTYVSADVLSALNAEIKRLDAEHISVDDLDAKYANIDFANIGEAAIEEFFAKSGLIKDVIVGDGTVTGELVGVTIRGDLIEGGTVVADKLVIRGEDGLYYKLNSTLEGITQEQLSTEEYQSGLHGNAIIANSITAEKIDVKDLVAFDATIGGFHISDTAIYSGVKESVDNTTQGIYFSSDSELAIGDANQYIKYFKDEDGNYKLDISAKSIKFGTTGKTVETVIIEEIQNGIENIEIGARNLLKGTKDFSSFYSNRTETEIIIDDDGYSYANFPVVDALDYRAISSTYAMLRIEDILNREAVLSFELRSDESWTASGTNIIVGFSLCNDTSTTRLRYRTLYLTGDITSDWLRHNVSVKLTEDFFANGTSSIDECTRFYVQIYNYSLNQLQVRKFKLEYGTIGTDWSPAPEDTDDAIMSKGEEIGQIIIDQVNGAKEYTDSQLEGYVNTEDFNTYTESVETRFIQNEEQVRIEIDSVTTTVNGHDALLAEHKEYFTNYFDFGEDGLAIGRSNSKYRTVLDNQHWALQENEIDVLWFDGTGKGYVPDLTVTTVFDLMGLKFEVDPDGNLNCEYKYNGGE